MSFTAEELYQLINDIVDKKFASLIKTNGIETSYNCKIIEIYQEEDNTDPFAQMATIVYVGDEDTMVYDVKNKSGQLLKAGDKAVVYAIKNSLSNAYIGRKYN